MTQMTLKERARAAGLSTSTVHNRMSAGMSLDEALSMPRQRRPAAATFALAVKHRINQSTLSSRLKSGMSIEQALATPICKSNSRKVSREALITEAWGRPADDVIRELRAKGKGITAVAETIGASITWTFKRVHALEKDTCNENDDPR